MCSKLKILVVLWVVVATVCAAPVPAHVELQTGRAVAYSEEWREAGPAVPGTNTGGSITTVGRLTRTKGNLEEAFLPEHQTAFVMDLTEGLVSRGIIARSADSAAAAVTIRFLKTEYFPDDRDYFLDALVAVMWADKSLERLYHVTTRDTNGKARGLFPTVAGGRKFVSDTLRGAIAADLAAWFASPGTPPGDGLRVGQRFDPCSDEIVGFLRDAYGPHSKREARVEVRVNRPSDTTASLEFRWRASRDKKPPFCVVDLYADGAGTQVVIQEYNLKATKRSGVATELRAFIRDELPAVK